MIFRQRSDHLQNQKRHRCGESERGSDSRPVLFLRDPAKTPDYHYSPAFAFIAVNLYNLNKSQAEYIHGRL
jgi:hypothetical protein